MGFKTKLMQQLSDPDKLVNFADKAQKAVSDNQEKLNGAIDKATTVVSEKTHGKYDTKIAKVGQAASGVIDKAAAGGTEAVPSTPQPAATHEGSDESVMPEGVRTENAAGA